LNKPFGINVIYIEYNKYLFKYYIQGVIR